MARLAHKLSQANRNVTADVVEVTEFPELAQKYDISSVPKTVINETVEIIGAISEGRFVDELLRAQGQQAS